MSFKIETKSANWTQYDELTIFNLLKYIITYIFRDIIRGL